MVVIVTSMQFANRPKILLNSFVCELCLQREVFGNRGVTVSACLQS